MGVQSWIHKILWATLNLTQHLNRPQYQPEPSAWSVFRKPILIQ
jgi:hypothetical protein